jgi:hypothetical protein
MRRLLSIFEQRELISLKEVDRAVPCSMLINVGEAE